MTLAERLAPYREPGFYLTFTDIDKVGINPNNQYKTPIGIYVYPIWKIYDDLRDGNFLFGVDRPHYHVLKPRTDRILDLESYTAAQFEQDYAHLAELAEKRGTSLAASLVKLTESGVYTLDSPGALLWALIQAVVQDRDERIGGLMTHRSTVRWNRLLRQMGYDLVLDTGSIIHLLQSAQAVFLSSRAFEVVDDGDMPAHRASSREGYWGTATQPFWHPGPNPTIDLVLVRDDAAGKEILLIERAAHAKAEPGKWALPGGFVDTNAVKGQPWRPGRESLQQAALRETAEETGLYLPQFGKQLQLVGVFEGGGRDPRDNAEAWVRSTVFALNIGNVEVRQPAGRDDAARAEWKPLAQLPSLQLAFDHATIVARALTILG